MRNAECGMRNAQLDCNSPIESTRLEGVSFVMNGQWVVGLIRNAEYGMRNTECGMRNAELFLNWQCANELQFSN